MNISVALLFAVRTRRNIFKNVLLRYHTSTASHFHRLWDPEKRAKRRIQIIRCCLVPLTTSGDIHRFQKWSSNWVRSSPARIYFETSKFSRSSVWQKKLSRAQWIYSLIISLCLSSLARVCLHAKRRKKKRTAAARFLSYLISYHTSEKSVNSCIANCSRVSVLCLKVVMDSAYSYVKVSIGFCWSSNCMLGVHG